MKTFEEFRKELLSMLHEAEKEHEAKYVTIFTYVNKFFKEEWDFNGESEKAFLPDPMMNLIALRMSEAEDKIREAQVLLSQDWYDGIASNYIQQLNDFTEKTAFIDGKPFDRETMKPMETDKNK